MNSVGRNNFMLCQNNLKKGQTFKRWCCDANHLSNESNCFGNQPFTIQTQTERARSLLDFKENEARTLFCRAQHTHYRRSCNGASPQISRVIGDRKSSLQTWRKQSGWKHFNNNSRVLSLPTIYNFEPQLKLLVLGASSFLMARDTRRVLRKLMSDF